MGCNESHQVLKQAMIDTAIELHRQNMLAGADGNISCRLSDGEILITPSGKAKRSVSAAEIAVITSNNQVLSGNPSSEMLMHTYVYRHCPQAKVVVHAHPPAAIAWTIAEPGLKALPCECMSELILATGGIPIAPFARPGSLAMGEVLADYLPQYQAIILARHGALTWGQTLEEALNGMERIEHSAQILLKARSLGPLTFLPEQEVAALYEMREKIGNRLL